MMRIRSMADLAQAREEALEKQRELAKAHRVHIRIGMSSCSMAAGAGDTLLAIKSLIEEGSLPGVNPAQVQLTQTGCNGLCALEPLIQVQVADQSVVTYGKVTAEVAHRILENHIGKGLVVQEHVVENI